MPGRPPRPALLPLSLALAPLVAVACAASEADTDPLAGLELRDEDAPDAPLRELSAEWQERFDAGDVAFEQLFRESQGLGPAYIRASCASCHGDDARGPGLVRKMVVVDGAGEVAADQSALAWGHTERPYVAGGAQTPLVAPEGVALLVTTRQPPAVFGRGYMEAVAEAEILRIEAEQGSGARGGGAVSGRVNRVCWDFDAPGDGRFHAYAPGACGLVGRFGLKARVATLDGFSADAYQGDMSITSPLRTAELPNPDGLSDDLRPGVDLDREAVELTADYMRLLAIPAPLSGPDDPGAALFGAVGCDACHVPTLRTEESWPIDDLAGIDAPLFTDLLLHDMGEGFSDGLTDGDAVAGAGPSEWRTAPLIGLRHLRSYLHDGRALTVEEAILAHGAPGSEAEASAGAYLALSAADRAALLTYVEGL